MAPTQIMGKEHVCEQNNRKSGICGFGSFDQPNQIMKAETKL